MASAEELWLLTQQQLVSRAAHEVKGALNGVSVNVEVVRSRAEREGSPASDVARFANAAGDQLTHLIRMTEALLGLTRAGRERMELGLTLRHLVALLDPPMKVDGGGIALVIEGGTAGATSAPATPARLALGTALLAAAGKGTSVQCTLGAASPPRVTVAPVAIDQLPAEVVDAVAAAGIVIATDGHGISIAFPA